ncbi:MAG: dihydrofolate reductase [Polyangiaceae bacterium]
MNARAPLALIAAVAENGVIGKDGGLPWRIPEDLKFFKETTKGHAVIMGRRTFEEVGKPLPHRRNIVVSSREGASFEGCETACDLASAVALARATDPLPFVIGGARLYEDALDVATVFYRTVVHLSAEGDTFFPDFPRPGWKRTSARPGDGVTFEVWERP